MTSRAWALCLISALPLLWAAPVMAQEDDKGPGKANSAAKDDDVDPDAPAPASKPTEGAKGEAHESLVAPKPTEPEEPPPVGPIERLPPTAYPEWQVRGITGGSLSLSGSMH